MRCLHRPERGTETTLTKTLTRALLWSKTLPNELKGSWISGPTLTSAAAGIMPAKKKWNLVFQKTIPVSIPCWDIPAMLLHGSAITLANADVEQRGPQVIAAQPAADEGRHLGRRHHQRRSSQGIA
jgi:hypothetical protein